MQGNKPVAYASKSLTQTERAYAQIEKELLAIVFACRKFHHMLYGRKNVLVETDHMPLVSIIGKPLGQVPMRLQKMLLKLQQYDIVLVGKSGKEIPIADALSRAPLTDCYYPGLVDEMCDYQVCVTEISSFHAFSSPKQVELRQATRNDPELQKLCKAVLNGWPENRCDVEGVLKPYWDFRDEISVYDGILFKGQRVIIPKCMQSHILKLIHSSHQGMIKSKRLARDVIFWTGMTKQIEDVVSKCSTCLEYKNKQQKEPMMSTETPVLPWQSVSCDLFQFENEMYLATIDHYSGYLEISELKENQTAETVIERLKCIFATHGIPKVLYSDPGSQFTSIEFHDFASTWGFEIVNFSAKNPQANGMAEKAVQIAKNLIKKTKKDNSDLQLALLDYRNTPRDTILGSPVQRCMSRRTKTRLPTCDMLLKPEIIQPEKVSNRLQECKTKNKGYYDRHAKPLSELRLGDTVRYRTNKTWTPAELVSVADRPRSYNLRTPSGKIINRNRRNILKTAESGIYQPARLQYQMRNDDDNDLVRLPQGRQDPVNRNVGQDVIDVHVPDAVVEPEPPTVNVNVERVPRVPAIIPAGKANVTTRSGRISKAPSTLKDFVK